MSVLYPGASFSLTGAAKILAFLWPDMVSSADAEIFGNARVQRTCVGGPDDIREPLTEVALFRFVL